jgi:hypothetical protein
MPIKHRFTSTKSDGTDTGLVRPSNWNDTHTGSLTPVIVQAKHTGTQVSSITLDSAPTVGHTLILALDGFSSAQATAISSTNTTWTQMAIFNDAGSAKLAIWAGIMSSTGGTTITITHTNGFMSASCLEIEDTLTPTAGTSVTGNTPSATSTSLIKMNAITAGHLVAFTAPVDNTGGRAQIFTSIPAVGLSWAIVPLIVGYSQGYPIYSDGSGTGGLIGVEIT